VLKSSLTYGVGAALGLMGLASCIVFFAVFRATPFSVVSAAGLVTWAAYQFRRSTGAKPMTLETWRKYKDEAFRRRSSPMPPRQRSSGPIRRPCGRRSPSNRRVNRIVLPILVLAGVGLLSWSAPPQENRRVPGESSSGSRRRRGNGDEPLERRCDTLCTGGGVRAPREEIHLQGHDQLESALFPEEARPSAFLYDPDQTARCPDRSWPLEQGGADPHRGASARCSCLLGVWSFSRRAQPAVDLAAERH